MKKSWNTPTLETLDISNTQYNQKKTNVMDAFIYDADTKEIVEVLGYTSGATVEG